MGYYFIQSYNKSSNDKKVEIITLQIRCIEMNFYFCIIKIVNYKSDYSAGLFRGIK